MGSTYLGTIYIINKKRFADKFLSQLPACFMDHLMLSRIRLSREEPDDIIWLYDMYSNIVVLLYMCALMFYFCFTCNCEYDFYKK